MSQVKPEWKIKDSKLDTSAQVFSQYPSDSTMLCLTKKNVVMLYGEINDCTYARKGLYNLIEAADVEYKEKHK